MTDGVTEAISKRGDFFGTRRLEELLQDTNLPPAPGELVGRNFVEISGMFLRHRDDRRSCILIGVQRGEDMVLNPIGNDAGELKAGDSLIVLSRVFLNLTQNLPTVPPVSPLTATT